MAQSVILQGGLEISIWHLLFPNLQDCLQTLPNNWLQQQTNTSITPEIKSFSSWKTSWVIVMQTITTEAVNMVGKG